MTAPERPSRADTDPAERGTLQIAPSVVRKIAERVADQIEGTAPVERRIAGVGVGHRGASVKVSGSGSDVDLTIDLALHYPAEVRSVVDAVRAAVTDEVRRVTSYRVRGVNVTVSALVPEAHSRVH